jgi:hypothetical protein
MAMAEPVLCRLLWPQALDNLKNREHCKYHLQIFTDNAYNIFETKLHMVSILKVHSHEKSLCDYPLNYSLDQTELPLTHFNF